MGIYDTNSIKYPGKQIEQYKSYLNNHINGVIDAWQEYKDRFINIFNLTDIDIIAIDKLMVKHDNSKTTKDEFEPYRKNFYPSDEEKDTINHEQQEKDYRYAILHHYHNNMHHWNYWVYYDINEPENPMVLDMPDIYIIELICDWISVSNNTKGDTSDPLVYYNKIKDAILLSETTRTKLEYALNKLFGRNNNE